MVDLRLDEPLEEAVHRLRTRMHSPLCGLMPALGVIAGPRRAPRFTVLGGDLTGVHVLRGQEPPKIGSYHIGGAGIIEYEAYIRALGETAERYSGFVAAVSGQFPVEFASHADMVNAGRAVLPADAFQVFTAGQLAGPGFPFDGFDRRAPIGWIEVPSLTTPGAHWVPAQSFLIGYVVRRHDGEPWLQSAVTTGTAVHTTHGRALLGALQEAAQIDAAMGHWYGRCPSILIRPDARTAALDRIIARHLPPGGYRPEFHLLRHADLPGLSVACLLRERSGRAPSVVVGLGTDNRLAAAMYRSLLEAVGVRSLAAWSLVNDVLDGRRSADSAPDLATMFDLESNVAHYATPEGADRVEERFATTDHIAASDLGPDDRRPLRDRVADLVAAYRATGKRLYASDLTGPDLRALGLRAMRIWSPDTLSLSLPSAPAAAHPRFGAYGGFRGDEPHPYP